MDKYDFAFILNKIRKAIPKKTNSRISFEHSFHKGIPKHLPSAFDDASETFLDRFECYIPKVKNYFNALNNPNVLACGFIINPFIFTSPYGIELEIGSVSAGSSNSQTDIVVAKITGGTAGKLYDRLAINWTTGGNNQYRLGVYDSVADDAENLAIQTGALSTTTAFAWTSVTEFALPTNDVWSAQQQVSSLDKYKYATASAAAERKESFTFGAFQNPITGLLGSNHPIPNFKIGHT